MELQQINNRPIVSGESGTHFIEANTVEMSLEEVKNHHIIPVFTKDNEPLISQFQLIEVVQNALQIPFDGEDISEPTLRVSHPIKGRVPNARNKPAKDLLESEKTIYYERAIFKIDIPSIYKIIDGQKLCLSVGGIKAYNQDSMSKDSKSGQHFTLFIGYKNTVCSNLCLWSDGSILKTTVTSVNDLQWKIERLFLEFQVDQALEKLKAWESIEISENQFVQFLGRSRLYPNLSKNHQASIFPLEITDSQMMSVAREYEKEYYSLHEKISLWQFYNLLTLAVKSSYIDSYLSRCVNSTDLTTHLMNHLNGKEESWFLI